MKIVYILNGITTEISGGDQHTLRLLTHQIQKGKEVSVVTSADLRLLLTHSTNFQSFVHSINWSLYDTAEIFPIVKVSNIHLFFRYIKRMYKSIFSIPKQQDTVYVASSHFFFDVIPLIFTPGNNRYVFVHHIVSLQCKGGIRGIYHRIFESISFAIMKILHVRIITVSPVISNVLRQKGFTKILESSNGIDEVYFEKPEGELQKRYDVVYCGRLHKSKGIYRFVDVLFELHKNGSTCNAAILGSGPEKYELEKYIHTLGLTEYISVLGYVSDELKRLIYTQAKVFLSASYEEGWGIAIGEAKASNLPIVSFWSTELEAVWGSDLIWVNSVFDAAKQVQNIFEGNYECTHEKIKNYTWEKVLETEDVYMSLFEKNRDILVLGSYGRGNIGDDVFLYAIEYLIDPRRVIINSAGTDRLPIDLKDKFVTIETSFLKNALHKLGILFSLQTVVYAGGDVWTLMYENTIQRIHLYKMLFVNLVLRLLGKKVIYLGTGVGDLDVFSIYLAKLSARLSQYVVFRDQESARKLNLPREMYSVLPDLASVLPVAQDYKKKKQIALSLLYHVSDVEKNYPLLKKAFVDLIHEYSLKGYKFIFVPMLKTDEIEHDDVWVGNDIKQNIGNIEYEVLQNHSVSDVIRVFGESELVIATRLHAAILSVLAKTPVLAVSYRGKVTRAMVDVGLGEFTLNIKDINKLNTSISYILDTYTEAKQKISDASEHITTHGQTYRSIISKYIS